MVIGRDFRRITANGGGTAVAQKSELARIDTGQPNLEGFRDRGLSEAEMARRYQGNHRSIGSDIANRANHFFEDWRWRGVFHFDRFGDALPTFVQPAHDIQLDQFCAGLLGNPGGSPRIPLTRGRVLPPLGVGSKWQAAGF